MTTVVASPPSFQSLPRLGWSNSNGSAGGLNAMSAEEVSRMFMPQRKSVQRTNSSSSIASSSSSNPSTSTVSAAQPSSNTSVSGESTQWGSKKKLRGGFWPSTKAEPVSGVTNARPQASAPSSGPAASAAMSAVHQISPIVPSQHAAQTQQNGVRPANVPPSNDPPAVLALLPMNGTFERKQISLPYAPDVLRIGRQTNAKTGPTPLNGFFDSKVLSRQHAEVWAERGTGKVWIKDVKSSNGTFVNGSRLSPENRESDPHELHEQDTLELGIDIVSEDQKTIVHHKVSAKVEFAGVSGGAGNILDLNFGDIDPSQNGGPLSSPLSQPMMHSRGRVGGPLPNGKLSATSSVAGSQIHSLAQQRQMNFWSVPLNVEQLVKTLSTEMRAARQQSQDLEQAGAFLTSVISPENKELKSQPLPIDHSSPKLPNGKPKVPKIDSISRFSEPPAPPPQQPLPEKPDVARSSHLENSSHFLKRSETARPGSNMSGSPTNPQSSQILSLVEALSLAKKELDSQGARMKHLEDMLRQERSARESAEERARRLEQHASFKPTTIVEEESGPATTRTRTDSIEPNLWPQANHPPSPAATTTASSERDIQKRLDVMVAEMDRLKDEMSNFQRRAESAETQAATTRNSLAEMITRFRAENAIAAAKAEEAIDSQALASAVEEITRDGSEDSTAGLTALSKQVCRAANGHIRTPRRLPEHLERAVAAVLNDSNSDGTMLAQSAPYASMLGVVLIGVGLMAYLNSWQKLET